MLIVIRRSRAIDRTQCGIIDLHVEVALGMGESRVDVQRAISRRRPLEIVVVGSAGRLVMDRQTGVNPVGRPQIICFEKRVVRLVRVRGNKQQARLQGFHQKILAKLPAIAVTHVEWAAIAAASGSGLHNTSSEKCSGHAEYAGFTDY